MDKYMIVTTLCDKEEIAINIINTLLEKKLIVGSQMTKVYSKYWWNNMLEERNEYKLEFRTKESLFNEIEKAESEYEKYRVIQDQKYVSTMDEFYNKYLEENNGVDPNE